MSFPSPTPSSPHCRPASSVASGAGGDRGCRGHPRGKHGHDSSMGVGFIWSGIRSSIEPVEHVGHSSAVHPRAQSRYSVPEAPRWRSVLRSNVFSV
jgi:hypothetical protein